MSSNIEAAEMERYAVPTRCGDRDSPAIQHLIEQPDRDLEETQRNASQGTTGTKEAHTSTLDLEDIRSRLRD